MNDALHGECTMGDLIVRAIERGADRVAFATQEANMTYRQFGEQLSRMVQALTALGLGRGSAIACLSGNSVEPFLLTASCYLMGMRITHLHPLASEDDHAFIIADACIDAFFVDCVGYGDRAVALRARLPGSCRFIALAAGAPFEDLASALAICVPARLEPKASIDDICYLVYTGGTTGKPKGVVSTHRTHLAMTMAELAEWEWPHDIIFLAITPISHGAGAMIMPVLLRSGTFIMARNFSPMKFFDLVKRHRVTITFLVPTMVYELIDHAQQNSVDVSSLETIIYGAALMSPARLREALTVFGPVFMQMYAQSEAPNCITVLRKRDHDPDLYPRRLSSCGMPLYTSQVSLQDGDGRPVADGETGEVCVRGPLVMKGYWNRPQETAQAFRGDWLRTGDLARRDSDGYYYIVGRSKDMIVSGGFNVYPAEVEDALTAHPAVLAAGVIGVPDIKWGEAVKAVVVLRAGCTVTREELTAHVRLAKGAVYAPKSVDFVDSLPLTALGKPDKKALRAAYGSTLVQSLVSSSSASPRSEGDSA